MDLSWTLLLDPVASTREPGLRPQGGYGLIDRLARVLVHGDHRVDLACDQPRGLASRGPPPA
jgi:hypothetical protein